MLSACDHGNELVVPDQYFDQLQAEINLRVRNDRSETEFVAPDQYFEDAQNRILAAVEDDKEDDAFFAEQQSQIMSEIRLREWIGHADEFAVPEGYFEGSSAIIKEKVFGAKVFQLRKWFSYAAAASVLIASLFLFLPEKRVLPEESFAELITKNPVDEDDLEYFSDEEDVFELYITLMEDDTTVVDSLQLLSPDQQVLKNDSITPRVKLDPKTGLPIDPSKKSAPVRWDDLSDEELMQYLFEEGDEEILNEIE